MHLVLRTSTPAPEKAKWHAENQKERGEWSDIFEIVSTWFCSSHTFNKADTLVIRYLSGCVVMIGEELRYLGPSLRSAASLIHKAFSLLIKASDETPIESTAGIWIYPNFALYDLPLPHILLVPSTQSSNNTPNEGTLFCFPDNITQEYYAPAERITQALVWYLQRR